jgi:hypothetical protein
MFICPVGCEQLLTILGAVLCENFLVLHSKDRGTGLFVM